MFMLILLVALSFFNINCATVKNEVSQMQLSREEIVEIANTKAIELGYDIEKMELYFDENNTRWNEYIRSGPILECDSKLKDKLGGKDYWALYYMLKEAHFGGDLWIFVDKNTGEIITFIKGE